MGSYGDLLSGRGGDRTPDHMGVNQVVDPLAAREVTLHVSQTLA